MIELDWIGLHMNERSPGISLVREEPVPVYIAQHNTPPTGSVPSTALLPAFTFQSSDTHASKSSKQALIDRIFHRTVTNNHPYITTYLSNRSSQNLLPSLTVTLPPSLPSPHYGIEWYVMVVLRGRHDTETASKLRVGRRSFRQAGRTRVIRPNPSGKGVSVM
jgi:hypothetical protein